MKLAAALAVAVTLALPASTGAADQRVLGIDTTVLGMRLGWYDAATLIRLPGKTVPLVSHEGPWSFSPDGTRLAVAGRAGDVRFIDLKRMRTQGVVSLKLKGPPSSVTWTPGRLLVTAGASVAVVDTQGLHLLGRTKLPGVVDGFSPVLHGVALLLAPAESVFAPAKVAVVGDDGSVRTVTLDRITIGFRQSGDTYDMRRAGFAVDPATRRAFVVGADDTIAAVDLTSLAFSYHGGASRYVAKPSPGPQRTAAWLGNGLLAVAGNNGFMPTGLSLVDTRDWSTRMVDPDSEDVTVSAGALVGSNWVDFTVYGSDGAQRYRSTLDSDVDLQVAGHYGYACHGVTLLYVVELGTGATVNAPPRRTCVTVLAR